MKLRDAAILIQAGYDNSLGSNVRRKHDSNGVLAFLLKDKTLVIPGTNDKRDWRRNLRVGTVKKGDSGRMWHQGFLEHATEAFKFAAPHNPRRVIGHSLGAAAAQIVAVSLNIPAICFASPRTLRGKRWFKGENKIINVCRYDDAVAKLPPSWTGFRHLGNTCWISSGELQSEGTHTLADYLRVLHKRSKPPLPDIWG